MGEDTKWGPIREERLLLYRRYGEFSESLEGDHGRDRVRRCHLLTSFQEGPTRKLFFQEFFSSKFCK